MFSHSFRLSKQTQSPVRHSSAGFSLVELLVSISVITIVISVILIRQNTFNSAVLLRGQAYEVALQTREVQLNAVGVSTDGGGEFRSVLGVYFNTDTAFNGQYTIFRDADLDGFYDSGEEFGQQGILDPRFEIRELRSIGGDAISGNELSVIFVRPNFDARFFDASGNELDTPMVEVDVARRDVTGTGVGVVRTIEITGTGQIAVQ